MKTALDGVVFLLPHVSGHAQREEMACAVRANPAEPGRWGGRTRRQNGAAEQGGKTERQDGAARRCGRTGRQDGAAEKEGEGKAGSSQRTGPGAPPAQTKKRAGPMVSPVLAPGFQPPGAAGQRKSARRSGPASAKGQCTGSQYAVRTPGRVQYYPHGRR